MTTTTIVRLTVACAVLAMGLGVARAQESPGTELRSGATESLPDLRRRAESGDADAQDQLGLRYARAEGVAEDYGEAIKWFGKAADQGLASAQLHLALMHSEGRGVEKDLGEASKWFRKAAEQNEVEAQLGLAVLYAIGAGVERDLVQARFWLDLAAAAGNAKAAEVNKALAESMTEAQIAEADALASGWEVRGAKSDDAAWQAVQESPRDISRYQSYLQAYPSGLHEAEARDAVAWREAETAGTREALRDYLSSRPQGTYALRAKKIERLIGSNAPPSLVKVIDETVSQVPRTTLQAILPPGLARDGQLGVSDESPFEVSLGEDGLFSPLTVTGSDGETTASLELWIKRGKVFYTDKRGAWLSENVRCVVGRSNGFPFEEYTEYEYSHGGWRFRRSVIFATP